MLLVLDSSGKGFPGLLDGTVSSLGDYDMCMNNVAIEAGQGMYCNLKLRPKQGKISDTNGRQEVDLDLTQAVPMLGYFSLNYALCFPSKCSSSDIEHYVRDSE